MLLDAFPDGLLHRDRYGATPLHYCALWNRYHLIPLFLSHHPQAVTIKDSQGELAMDYASNFGKCEAAALLSDPELTVQRYVESLQYLPSEN